MDVRVDAVGKALAPYDPALAKIVVAPLVLLAVEAMDVAISIGGVELHPSSLPGMSAPYAMYESGSATGSIWLRRALIMWCGFSWRCG